jgi:predicted NBD/HSP70 family sugar kinase
MRVSIALDVGGTKTTVGLIEHTKKNILKKTTHRTVTGRASFPLFIGDLIKTALKTAQDEGYSLSSRVCVALPGNFPMGPYIRIKKGSARQLIHENEEFHELNITPWLTEAFPKRVSLFAINDAMAQAVGGVYTTWCDDYANKVMLYIGPGTGLGGAILQMGDDREDVALITDGHIYDVMVDSHGHQCMAEDILSGRGIFNRTGVVAKALSECDDYWNHNQGVIDDCADCAVQIVMNIKQKTIQKKCFKNNWSPSDIALAATFEHVLLGGSIGTKGRLGRVLNQHLSNVMDGRVTQLKDPDGNALIGAVLMGEIHGQTLR